MLFRNVLKYVLISKRYYSCDRKKALVFLAPGHEEMEAIISIDVLRRAGVDVTVASLSKETTVKGAHNINISADIAINDVDGKGPFDAIVLPGGLGGAKAMGESKEVGKLLKEQECAGRIVAAICAAPLALKQHEVFKGKKLTAYPGVADQLQGCYNYECGDVVVDCSLTTSRGPATAFKFAMSLVEQLTGAQKAEEVSKAMLLT